MNVIDAVRKLKADGGRVRRACWRHTDYVTLAGDQPIYHWMRIGAWGEKLVNPMEGEGTCLGRPTAEEILAEDWLWEPSPPKAEPKPSEPIPASAWEQTITIRIPR